MKVTVSSYEITPPILLL